MLFGNATMSTSNYRLGIGDNTVNPRQKLSRSFRISKDNFVMGHSLLCCHFPVGSPAIAANRLHKLSPIGRCHSTAEPIQEALNGFGGGGIDHLHMGKARPLSAGAVSIKRYRAQNRALTLAASPSFTSPRPEKRIIQLYQTRKPVLGIPVRHRLAYLMGHQPCRLVISDCQNPLHLRDRYTYFVHSHMVDEPIPFDQGCASSVENRPRRQTDLGSTPFTIEDLSRPDEPRFLIPTPRTLESIRPSDFSKMPDARLLSGKLTLKLKQAPFHVSCGHPCTPSSRVH
jgi:hypothetical protein